MATRETNIAQRHHVHSEMRATFSVSAILGTTCSPCSVGVCVYGAVQGTFIWRLENPPRSSWLWELPSFRKQQCVFGSKCDLWIKMLTTNPELQSIANICDKKHTHTAWIIV